MIQPWKYSSGLSFKANTNVNSENSKPSLKTRFTDAIKVFNTTTNTVQGVSRGVVEGIFAAGLVGLIGKNIKSAKSNIFKTLWGVVKDIGAVVGATLKSIPGLLTEAPIKNLSNVASLPKKFYKNYLKDNKVTAVLATVAALGVLAFRTIQGKINANLKNADVDHATKTKHY